MIRQEPAVRSGVYDQFWHFAAKRHDIFLRRFFGEPQPWTDDEILLNYKFCNTYRVLDRASQYLVGEICYSSDRPSAEDLIFQITAYRMFSRIETWEGIKSHIGRAPTIEDLKNRAFESALTQLKGDGGPLYTNAFIICANNAFGYKQKYLNHVALFMKMFVEDEIGKQILSANSLQAIYSLLHAYPLYGDFMSYQTAIDINYSDLVDFSENDFTVAGPGALRGIQKLFTDTNGYTASEIIHWMVERQDYEFQRLGIEYGGLWGRKIQAIDAQNVFCETDKYLRVHSPELSSNRSRIKTRFRPSDKSLSIYLPPKWGVSIPD